MPKMIAIGCTLAALAMMFLSLDAVLAFAASTNDFLGNWVNVDSNTRGTTKLNIKLNAGIPYVEGFGKCSPADCPWGSTRFYPLSRGVQETDVVAAIARWNFGFKETTMTFRLDGSELVVESFNVFLDDSGRSNYTALERFRAPSISEDCIPFNPAQAQVKKVNGRWKIVVGNMWLLDFESNKQEAERSLSIIQHYSFNKQCFVGRPDPSMEYYLVNNQAPQGSLAGEDCVSFNPDNIEVKKVQGRWKVIEGSHWILDFGNSESEARTAFNLIRQYHFDRICFVGRPDPSLTYFKSSASTSSSSSETLALKGVQSQLTHAHGASRAVEFTVEGQSIKDFTIEVFDLASRIIFDSGFAQGNRLQWSLQDNHGKIAATGVYLYVVTIRGFNGETIRSPVKKLLVLR